MTRDLGYWNGEEWRFTEDFIIGHMDILLSSIRSQELFSLVSSAFTI